MMRINPSDHVVLGLLLMGVFALAPQPAFAVEQLAAHDNQTNHHTAAATQSCDLKGKESDAKGTGPSLKLGRKDKPRPGDYLPIQVDVTGLRNVPRLLSRPTIPLRRGARVLVLETKIAWTRVQFGTHIGWVRTETLLPYYSFDLRNAWPDFGIDLKDPKTWGAGADCKSQGARG